MNLIRGALLAGGFRSKHEIDTMSADDQRNTLIVEMTGHTNQPVSHFQSLDDNALAGAAGVLAFLRTGRSRTDAQLRTVSDDDQRNILIVEVGARTRLDGPTLQAMTNVDLVLTALRAPVAGSLGVASYLPGILVAGGFRSHGEVIAMSHDDQRNTLIVEMTKHSNQPVQVFQALSDAALEGVGAVMVFLRAARIRTDAELATISPDDQRNILIVEVDGHTHAGARLQGLSNIDLVAVSLGADLPVEHVAPTARDYRFSVDSIEAHVQKSDGDHSDSDWLTILVSVGDPVTKAQRQAIPAQTFHIEGAIKSGDVIRGPFKTDLFTADESELVFVTYTLTNLGSSRAEDQGKEAVQVTEKVVDIAGPVVGTAVGLFFGAAGEGLKIGQQVAVMFRGAIAGLSDIFDFLGLHFGPPNCNGLVFGDMLAFAPGEAGLADGKPASRRYTGSQEQDRCGGAPETTINYTMRRLPLGGVVSPDF